MDLGERSCLFYWFAPESKPCKPTEETCNVDCVRYRFDGKRRPTSKSKREEKIEQALANSMIALCAIIENSGHWVKGVGACGKILCPVCRRGTLSYSRAACNGHVAARCSTPDCVNFIQ